ncbi:MAG: serine/threonine protein phosphatase, partial [Fibrobacter sp.]|nr:serine/threonine protein phosphatase [Fibrobacter sp.]
MGFYFRGLAFKQTMMILIVVTVVVGTIFGIMTSKMNGKLEQMTIDNGEQTSEASVTYINSIFDAAKTIGEEIAARLGSQEMTREELDNYLLRSLEVARNSVPQIIAVVTAWEPGKGPETKTGDYMKLAYFVNNESKLVAGANYDVHEWYKSTVNFVERTHRLL